MNQSGALLQLLSFQIRAVFARYWDILHGRIVVISIFALLLTPPAALSAYLHAWVALVHRDPFDLNQGLALGFTELLNILVLFIHSKLGLPTSLRQFELSLPVGKTYRRISAWTESALIQFPSLVLLFIAYLAQLIAYGRGIGLLKTSVIGICFVGLMTANCIASSLVSQLLPQFNLTVPMPNLGFIRIELRKLLILFKNRRRQFVMGAAFLVCLSALGWSIAFVPSADQPKQFLWLMIFGISLLVVTPITYALNSLDETCDSFIFTLPTSMSEQQLLNTKVSRGIAVPLLIQMPIWSIMAGYGWASVLIELLFGAILMRISHLIYRGSEKGFVLRFMVVVLFVAWIAEKVHL